MRYEQNICTMYMGTPTKSLLHKRQPWGLLVIEVRFESWFYSLMHSRDPRNSNVGWSDCAAAQSDLSCRLLYMHYVRFRNALAHNVFYAPKKPPVTLVYDDIWLEKLILQKWAYLIQNTVWRGNFKLRLKAKLIWSSALQHGLRVFALNCWFPYSNCCNKLRKVHMINLL